MSLRHNVATTYASQIYVTLLSLAVMPIYLRYMGSEAYGLVGFFTMLQAWFQILDMGLGPALSRDIARQRAGAIPIQELRVLFSALENIFILIAVLGAVALTLTAPYVASHWIKTHVLSTESVAASVLMMGLTIPLRWIAGLYRSVIAGHERMAWLAGFNAAGATARFPGALLVLELWSKLPTTFFAFQLFVAVLEFVILAAISHRLLPRHSRASWREQLMQVRRLGSFSLMIAATAVIWITVTQVDKLLLSHLLTLSDYGYFSLAIVVAGGVNLLAAPISQALLPTLARLHAKEDHAALIATYRKSSQLTCLITIPCALMLSFFPEQILFAWINDINAAHKAAPIIAGYAIGNAILAISAFPYLLQYARGSLRLHLLGNLLLVMILVPAIIWISPEYGAVGAAGVWLAAITLYFLVWVTLSHAKLEPGLHGPWVYDIARIAGASLLTTALLHSLVTWPQGRLSSVATVLAIWLAATITGALSANDPTARRLILKALALTRHHSR
ncbi:oligosaccharide flippase family protein [Roseateles violae]|uniref:Oligosaccharide flippase family protein n=1 Tax=Roseateles violae TaxID=3058042 RepID=A0ABT8DSC6_9BURK|nr:oligosaccharide flippase family protein [Pelomonas sp. PFR6]MDN3920946.1 oligosaccharide flippase family protein [Pelomonas sp. PFR6]